MAKSSVPLASFVPSLLSHPHHIISTLDNAAFSASDFTASKRFFWMSMAQTMPVSFHFLAIASNIMSTA